MFMDIVLLFEVHQPYRLRREIALELLERGLKREIGLESLEEVLFDNDLNKLVIGRASEKCYIPATRIMYENIVRYMDWDRPFKVSYSISGVFIEQIKRWKPEVMDLFRKILDTGLVEFVEQTYYHSLAAFMPLVDWAELREQIYEHRKLMEEEFGYKPVSIENTEFSYNNDIACLFHSMGYKVVLTEGVDWLLGWRSPNYVYRAYGCDMKVLTRNYRLSDDIGYRFSDRNWDQYPLTADKYSAWLSATPGDVVLIAIDYETIGEHHWPETGIYEFFKWLPGEVLKYKHLSFSTPREVVDKYPARDVYDVPPWSTISWADERDLSAWLGNEMQRTAFKILVDLRTYVKALDNPVITRLWKLLTISDHFYYIATKHGSLEAVHSYFSPYKNTYLAYGVLLQALSILSSFIYDEIGKRRSEVLKKIRLPSDKAFHFTTIDGAYTGVSAHSLREFVEAIDKLPLDSIINHLNRRDIQKWLTHIFGLDDVAVELDMLVEEKIYGDELRNRVKKIILDKLQL